MHEMLDDLERFTSVARAFQADVRNAISLFEEHLGISEPMDWRSHGLEQTGTIDEGGQHFYAFHGIGCCVHLSSDRVIDWDFGHEGRIDGFDLWRLERFLETRTELFPNLPKNELAIAFERARLAGSIVSPWSASGDSLFYLKSDVPEHAA